MHPRARRVRKILTGTVAGAAVVLLGAGQAYAHAGSGTFTGYEIPPSSVTLAAPPTVCATFHASASDPLIQEISMSGTFHSVSGSGSATYTRTSNYWAGPGGTYSNASCTTPATVRGSMTITFANWSCSDSTATYQRLNTDDYVLRFTSGVCDDTSTGAIEAVVTTAVFTGTQLLCPPEDCSVHPEAATVMSGSYSQSG